MPTTQSNDKDDVAEKKRQKWQEDYLDAVDLRPAHEKQLDETSNTDLDDADE